MIEDVQQNMRAKRLMKCGPLLLPLNRGSVLTRRLLAELISARKYCNQPRTALKPSPRFKHQLEANNELALISPERAS